MLFLLDWAPHIFPFKALLNPLISLVALLWILQFTSFWEMSFPQPPATAELIHAGITLTVLAVPPEWTCIFQNIIYQYFKSFQVSLLSHENLLCAAMRDIPIFGHTETQAYTHIHVHFKLISFFLLSASVWLPPSQTLLFDAVNGKIPFFLTDNDFVFSTIADKIFKL